MDGKKTTRALPGTKRWAEIAGELVRPQQVWESLAIEQKSRIWGRMVQVCRELIQEGANEQR